jgi:hypothetical protein
MSTAGIIGWESLRHGGLLLDAQRLKRIGEFEPQPLSPFFDRELRRQAVSIIDGSGDVPAFVTFVLKDVCAFSESAGRWQRGSNVSTEWGRVAITGETIKPRQLWRGSKGGVLPVFFDSEKRIGLGRGKRATSQVLQWLRAGPEKLALITNGRQWRLIFAGLDFDAWCEWDLDLWFEEGELSPQVAALRTLFSPALWTPTEKDERPQLLQAIQDSRKGQAELSAVLGERVREAVELVVQGHGEVLKERCPDIDPAEIYRAAVRMVMRLVVVLFAESRELLPRDNSLYHGSYGVTGLLEELEKIAARGGNRLLRSWNAWPRVLSLFRLVHQGSHHPELAITAYGGELFAPGEADSPDGLSRALAVFESACYERELMSDRDVHRVLERITRTRIKLRQGRSSTWVPAPVDFSDLSSEYIGILYEGLLDFELRTAPGGDPVIFLAVGNQPALPLSRLEAMDDKALANLLEKMKDTSSGNDEAGEQSAIDAVEESAEEEASDEIELADEDDQEEPDDKAIEEEPDDVRHTTRTRAEIWARRAVEAGSLVRRPRGQLTPERRLTYEEAVGRKARQLVTRVILPGEWYLVRWGGTRKGGGTFYTRPGLAVPTVQRTLRPLAYTPPLGTDGSENRDAPAFEWRPKLPEDILALKVCDPACGSGSFPVASLRFLTDALYLSLHSHQRLKEDWRRPLDELLGLAPQGVSDENLKVQRLPCSPEEGEFEQRTKAVLRRYVVERCIYGVDLDPLAVELCRLALWIETMDRTLPFSFLDHKIKSGNSLTGTWFDQFQHYPVMAWKNREGGDKNHSNGVYYEKEARTKAIKSFVKDKLTPDLKHFLQGRTLFSTEDPLERARSVHGEALKTLSRLHDLPVQDSAERARIYREELLGSNAYSSLKAAMDLWCACWFWPAEELDNAPLPTAFHEPSETTRDVTELLAARKCFFHWELEFPDVFRADNSGFDAMLGNPPWENSQPNPEEFFSNIDPLFRTYGRLIKKARQREMFTEDHAAEKAWLDYAAEFNNFSHWVSHTTDPFGDPQGDETGNNSFSLGRGGKDLHSVWRVHRLKSKGYASSVHPFHFQVGRIFTYKLFLEYCHALLRPRGRLGQIVPSGIYSDAWSQPLRQLFLDECRWEWLFGFENRDKVFEIDGRFKFNPIIVEKSASTEFIRAAFMRRKLEDWEVAEDIATAYSRDQVEMFSPRSKAILEIQSQRDLEILEKIYAKCVRVGDDCGWRIRYRLEFMMNTDAVLFPPLPKWEEQGYRPDEYSRWLKGDWRPIDELWAELITEGLSNSESRCAPAPYERFPIPRANIPAGIIVSRNADQWIREESIEDTALPLYEGRMVGQFDYSQKGWVSGKGRGAVWRDMHWEVKRLEPQFLMASTTYASRSPEASSSYRAVMMDVTSTTNERTVISAFDAGHPCGHKAPTLTPQAPVIENSISLVAVLDSFIFDYLIRSRLGGNSLIWSVLEATALPKLIFPLIPKLTRTAGALCLDSRLHAAAIARAYVTCDTPLPNRSARTDAERVRCRSIVDAVVAAAYGLEGNELRYVLAGCDLPRSALARGSQTNPKGFWRVDKDRDPELRHTVLTIIAFHDLEEKIRAASGSREQGIESFMDQNGGGGWMLPETVRLADYKLGHDERAKEHQPVASRLGPRFYDWQLAQSAEESWRECHLHARNLLGESGYQILLADIETQKLGGTDRLATPRFTPASVSEDPQNNLFE